MTRKRAADKSRAPGKRTRGRPTRAETHGVFLEAADIAGCDPIKVLKAIALDPAQPAVARVAACRLLLRHAPDPVKANSVDLVTERAIASLAGKRTLN